MLINRPKQTICKVGPYNIVVASDNGLEDGDKFYAFCNELKGVLMALTNASQIKKEVVQ